MSLNERKNIHKNELLNGNSIAFTLLSYNQEKCIADAIAGLFKQEIPADEIIISDDGSADASREKIKNALSSYQGTGRIVFNANEKNIGCGANRSKVMSLVRAHYCATADGDDISLSNRIALYHEILEKVPDAVCIMTAFEEMREGGGRVPCPMGRDIFFCGCSALYRRDLFADFDNFPAEVIDDLVLSFRALLKGKIVFVDIPSILKREPQDPLEVMKKILARENLVGSTILWMQQELQTHAADLPSDMVRYFNEIFARHREGALDRKYQDKWSRYRRIVELYSLSSWRILEKFILAVKISGNWKEFLKLFFLSFVFIRILNINRKRWNKNENKEFSGTFKVVDWTDLYSGKVSWPFFQK